MENPPWAVELHLPDEVASGIIQSQFPQLAPVIVTGRYEGWDNQAVEINGEWIFRFPKRSLMEPEGPVI